MTSVFVVVVFLVELCFQGAVRKTCPLGGDIIFMEQFLSHQKWGREGGKGGQLHLEPSLSLSLIQSCGHFMLMV